MIVGGCIVPHPPLIVPAVGKGREKSVALTAAGYHKVMQSMAELKPDTVIVISPHARAYADYFHLASGTVLQGNLWQFGCEDMICLPLDAEIIEELGKICNNDGFPAGILNGAGEDMDHGTYIPLHFLNQYYTGYRLVSCSISGLPLTAHYQFGTYIKRAIEKTGRRTVIVASGDLSHKLTQDGPYGFAEEGPQLDRMLVEIMKKGKFEEFVQINDQLRRKGAECGVGAFAVLAGVMAGQQIRTEFYSYEGQLGVGYAICGFV